MKMVYATKEMGAEHYAKDDEWLEAVGQRIKAKEEAPTEKTPKEYGQQILDELAAFISMSPVVAMVVEGHNAVAAVRKLVGDTAPDKADIGTIRGDYSVDTYDLAGGLGRPIQNLIHATGETHEAEREINLWFKPEELHSYMRVDEPLVYRKGGQ